MKQKLYKSLFISTLALLFAGCSNFLDVQPNDKQTDEQLYATKGGFYSASNGAYNKLASSGLYGQKMSFEFIDLISKRYNVLSSNTLFTSMDSWTYSDADVESTLNTIWSQAYSTIINCNVILKHIEEQNGILSTNEAKILKGEMLAMRAFLHFDMLRLFGPIYVSSPHDVSIPYNELPNVAILDPLPADSVLNYKILRDINEAESLLSGIDPVISEGPLASAPSAGESVQLRYRQLRFNYYSVLALKARVQLYAGDKVNALATAKRIINDASIQANFPAIDPNKLLANATTPDRVFSTETFMGIYLKKRSNIFTYYFDNSNARTSLLQPRADFVDGKLFAGETSDYRYQSQWQAAQGVGASGHIFIKYKEILDPDTSLFYGTYLPLIRMSEVYYIASECEPNISDGYTWLNVMRSRRGLPDAAVVSESDLMSKIRMEYLKEFLGEGQIFFMYKRMYVNIIANENGHNTSTYGASEARYVPSKPQSEIENR